MLVFERNSTRIVIGSEIWIDWVPTKEVVGFTDDLATINAYSPAQD
jgi:hypothetical protein